MFESDYRKKLIQELTRIADTLDKIYILFFDAARQPERLNIHWYIGAKLQMSTQAIPLPSTSTAVGVVTELNNDGSVFKFDPSKIAVAVKDQTVLTASVDPATGNVTVTPVAAGSTDVIVADTATGVQSSVYTFTVSQVGGGPVPASLSVSWTVNAAPSNQAKKV